MKIAHLSDIHFFHLKFDLKSIFSKSLLGNFNYLINRKKDHVPIDVFKLPKILKEMGVTDVIYSGDITTTSNEEEYQMGQAFVEELINLDLKLHIIPGNHDNYTKASYKEKRFYKYIPVNKALEKEGVFVSDLGEGYKLVSLDTTLATPLWSSQGLFSKELEKTLLKHLDSFDPDQNIILLNHFPAHKNERPIRHQMKRRERLYHILKCFSNIKLYLFGHTHKSEAIEEGPLMLNSGSLTLTKNGSFHIYDLTKDNIEVVQYQHIDQKWSEVKKKNFKLS